MIRREGDGSFGISRRRAIAAIVTGAGGVVLAACGPGVPVAAPPTSKPAAASAAPPVATTASAATTAPASAATSAPAPAPTPAATAAPAAAASAQPRTGGMLRSSVVGEPPSLEGRLFAGNNFETVNQVFDQLTNYDANSVPQPCLPRAGTSARITSRSN